VFARELDEELDALEPLVPVGMLTPVEPLESERLTDAPAETVGYSAARELRTSARAAM
jgi:hypothetical protein